MSASKNNLQARETRARHTKHLPRPHLCPLSCTSLFHLRTCSHPRQTPLLRPPFSSPESSASGFFTPRTNATYLFQDTSEDFTDTSIICFRCLSVCLSVCFFFAKNFSHCRSLHSDDRHLLLIILFSRSPSTLNVLSSKLLLLQTFLNPKKFHSTLPN